MHYSKLSNKDWKMVEERIEETEQLERQVFIGGWSVSFD
jgi:hypothetical protein